MKTAIIGGGFTGLTCALRLLKNNHEVTVFEKEKSPGGLAGTFKNKGWQWPLEKHYHHFFTGDYYIYQLAEELGIKDKIIIPESLTSVYLNGRIYPFNLPSHILNFSPLSFSQRLRVGAVSSYLKLLPSSFANRLEKYTSFSWLKKYYGEKAFSVIWEPLLNSKFQKMAGLVNMTWTWARIKKRTFKLGYFSGGYQTLIDEMVKKIENLGGKILLGTSFDGKKKVNFDKIIACVPSSSFIEIFPNLPDIYKKKLNSISHLFALSLVLVSNEKLLDNTYWLSINDKNFPFIAIIQHTNYIDKKYYGGKEVAYIANYLPENHPYLKMSKEELFKVYQPYLKKINPSFFGSKTLFGKLSFRAKPRSNRGEVEESSKKIPPLSRQGGIGRDDERTFQTGSHFSLLTSHLFPGLHAQPVFTLNYSKKRPGFHTPIPNIYLANMDMIYPWDRGVNYAIETGYKVAEII